MNEKGRDAYIRENPGNAVRGQKEVITLVGDTAMKGRGEQGSG